jgi:hypothetical protein
VFPFEANNRTRMKSKFLFQKVDENLLFHYISLAKEKYMIRIELVVKV